MYSKELLLETIQNEFRILKHLATKVTAENQYHKIADGTRTAFELMKYLAFEAPAQINLIVNWWRDADLYKSWQDKGTEFTYDQFATKLDEWYAYIVEAINWLSQEQLDTEFNMWGMSGTRTKFLISYFLVFLWAYKTQLFLILKSSGLNTLGTWNLRAGMDEPQK